MGEASENLRSRYEVVRKSLGSLFSVVTGLVVIPLYFALFSMIRSSISRSPFSLTNDAHPLWPLHICYDMIEISPPL
jgi:hypothetical protein